MHTQFCRPNKPVRIRRTDGLSASPLYNVWYLMLRRCYSETSLPYKDYGGRGIQVCEEWRNSLKAFVDYVSQLPNCRTPGYSFDRIDNDGNYEPGNVRWATAAEQSQNRGMAYMVTLDGKTQCASVWARELGLPEKTIHRRLRDGWEPKEALTTPIKTQYHAKTTRTPQSQSNGA